MGRPTMLQGWTVAIMTGYSDFSDHGADHRIYLSENVAAKFELSMDKVVEPYWQWEQKKLAIRFVGDDGTDAQQLFRRGLFRLREPYRVGAPWAIVARTLLRSQGLNAEGWTVCDVSIEELEFPDEGPAEVAVIDLTPLFEQPTEDRPEAGIRRRAWA